MESAVPNEELGDAASQGLIVFSAFNAELPRRDFDCGNPDITRWFREHAGQQERSDNVRTTLGLATFDSRIATFYSLVAHRIELDELARSTVYSARRYPIPAILIAQLAVDVKYQGQRLGALTLGHALATLADTSHAVGFEAVVVDAIDDTAQTFYAKYGFTELVDGGRRMVLPTAALRASNAASQ